MKRRFFIAKVAIAGSLPSLAPKSLFGQDKSTPVIDGPIAVCTWNFKDANAAAGKALMKGEDALSAAISAAEVEEENIDNSTVGLGGTPDRDGRVTLDACVMDHNGNCGAVLAVENVVHVAALARDVMEKTPHVMLAGHGAEQFARSLNYPSTPLLTAERKKAWEKWKHEARYQPIINIENHDTIGVLCRDKAGNISGACSTSGLGYKMSGRIGDSPIIGSGLFIDNQVGGAVATGMGEEVVKTVGSFLIVELMRQGKTPQEACDEAIKRILEKQVGKPNFQVAYIALDKKGNVGARSIHDGFSYMHYNNNINQNINVQPI
ncbi:N(4)-(beta-N-acetylglucosaminyl)-L-asparaginase [Flavobacteriaceae bacterium]|nr:N(4)-(beta-N-acetylglucosaminyl)-L-asparaginase [Flavobacteriaceae bacterium]MDB4186947.1 N(4)-(beta-N-acetylglucosaminyl)-L-asparaginase [Flavobacteriaceae bacterium]